ncbi:hypothetical protein JOB18_002348 [Solea senegalensis]|uniref:Uncharacterized protein n=1 Tax=Solea senegalensis TaxID=28829 RepID=A0AAV6R3H4_SOLSE|nr:hypothetical protein JOB18_002348 [Solea senegalensis]
MRARGRISVDNRFHRSQRFFSDYYSKLNRRRIHKHDFKAGTNTFVKESSASVPALALMLRCAHEKRNPKLLRCVCCSV